MVDYFIGGVDLRVYTREGNEDVLIWLFLCWCFILKYVNDFDRGNEIY